MEGCVSSDTLLTLRLLRLLAVINCQREILYFTCFTSTKVQILMQGRIQVINCQWEMLYKGHERVSFPRRTLISVGEFALQSTNVFALLVQQYKY